jgi:uncharacterized protein YndB with AHSA1/START domain
MTQPTDPRELVSERLFDAPRARVFDAFCDPKQLVRWWGPKGFTSTFEAFDLRPGGAWRFGWAREDGSDPFEMYGAYEEVSPPNRLVNTEAMGDFPPTRNVQVLTETDDGKTLLTATVTYVSPEAMEGALASGMKDGWSKSYDRLDDYMARAA